MLDQIQTGAERLPRRLCIYGVAGVGKTHFAAKAEKPIFIQTEDGLTGLDVARFPKAESLSDVFEAIIALYNGDHDYKTLIIDSLDWLERLIWAEVCKKREVESIEEIGYAKGYKFALMEWDEILEGLDGLRNKKGMTIVLISHASITQFKDPENDPYDRYGPKLHDKASSLIMEWCDEVFFANYRVHTKKTDAGFDKTRTQGIGDGERALYTSEQASFKAKNRLGLDPEMALDWQAYQDHIDGNVK